MTDNTPAAARWRSLSFAKRGNQADEIEDALAASDATGRFAVADGVTDSIFSGFWARLLVDEFIASSPLELADWSGWLAGPREAWRQDVHQRSLPWYASHKLTTGAAATFVGLQVFQDGRWDAAAVGDACLFHLRSELVRAFPVRESSAFNNRPQVICSNPGSTSPRIEKTNGEWRPGDKFALATDSLAHWLLAEHERDQSMYSAIERLIGMADDAERIETELNALRDSRRLRNDDVALLVVQL